VTPEEVVAVMHDDLEGLALVSSARAGRVIRASLLTALGSMAGGGEWSMAVGAMAAIQLREALVLAVARVGAGFVAEARSWAKVSARRMTALLRGLDKRFAGAVRPLNFDALKWAEQQGDRLGTARLRMFRGSLARYGVAAAQKIEDAATSTALLGMPWYEASKRVRSGVLAAAGSEQWQIDRLMRTEVATVYNGASLAALEEEDDEDEPMLKRLSATFDSRTGRDSVAAHGQVRRVGEPFVDIAGRSYQAPPNRPNDREIVLPHRARWGPVPPALGEPSPAKSELGRSRDDSPETKRAVAALARTTSEVGELRRARAAGVVVDASIEVARQRVREAQIVVAARRVGDRAAAGRGVRVAEGVRVSLGGVVGRVVSVRGQRATVEISGQRFAAALTSGRLRGGSRYTGRGVRVPEELSAQAAAMIGASLAVTPGR
jgi:hypothetical protein